MMAAWLAKKSRIAARRTSSPLSRRKILRLPSWNPPGGRTRTTMDWQAVR
jgi:hypothetical protein